MIVQGDELAKGQQPYVQALSISYVCKQKYLVIVQGDKTAESKCCLAFFTFLVIGPEANVQQLYQQTVGRCFQAVGNRMKPSLLLFVQHSQQTMSIQPAKAFMNRSGEMR